MVNLVLGGQPIEEEEQPGLFGGTEEGFLRVPAVKVFGVEIAFPGFTLQASSCETRHQALDGRTGDVGHPVGAVQGEMGLENALAPQAYHQAA